MKLVVMQPTYLPWIGYFDLIDQSDVFVLYDSVQFEKQSWQQRNRIKSSAGAQWITVPVLQSLGQLIQDVQINNTDRWRHRHWMALLSSYRRAAAWADEHQAFEAVYQREWSQLADLNIEIITAISRRLGFETRFVRSSSLPPLTGAKTEPLLALCRHFGADTYLSPAGARAYLDDEAPFRAAGVRLEFHNFEHPTWSQLFGDFVPHLSVVDLMMNRGTEAAAIIRAGRRPATTLATAP
jgi:hypothetical protein